MSIMYRLKLTFENPDTFVLFPVSEEVAGQVRSALLAEQPSLTGTDFLVFATLDGRTVVLRSAAVSLCNVLFDSVGPVEHTQTPREDDDRQDGDIEDDEDDEDEDWSVRILINGAPKVFETEASEGADLARLLTVVEYGAVEETPFFSFTDEDGEELIVNLLRLAYIEVPTAQLEEESAE